MSKPLNKKRARLAIAWPQVGPCLGPSTVHPPPQTTSSPPPLFSSTLLLWGYTCYEQDKACCLSLPSSVGLQNEPISCGTRLTLPLWSDTKVEKRISWLYKVCEIILSPFMLFSIIVWLKCWNRAFVMLWLQLSLAKSSRISCNFWFLLDLKPLERNVASCCVRLMKLCRFDWSVCRYTAWVCNNSKARAATSCGKTWGSCW